MVEPPIPNNEVDRIAGLRNLKILDTLKEERFDRITKFAQDVFSVPIVLVSLVDSTRQWFKSCIGLSVNEVPRSISFCGHAILSDEPLIITDSLADPRFSDNPLVVNAPFIRFYAGIPLHAPQGHRIGSFCIIDSKPRTLSFKEIDTLKGLARWVELELNFDELKINYEKVNHLTNYQKALLYNAGYSIISTDTKGIIKIFNPSAERMLGYTAEEVVDKMTPEMIHDQKEIIQRAKAFSTEMKMDIDPGFDVFVIRSKYNLPNTFEWTYIRKDGSRFPVLLSVSALRDDQQNIYGYLGVATDISNLNKTQDDLGKVTQRFELAKESAAIGVWDWDVVNNVLIWDEKMYRLYGLQREDFKGAYDAWQASLYWEDKTRSEQEIEQALSGEKEFNTEFRVQWPDQSIHWIKAHAKVTRDSYGKPLRMTGVNWDVSDKKGLEQRQALQNIVTRIIAESDKFSWAIESILSAICNYLHWNCGAIWLLDEEQKVLRLNRIWHKPEIDILEFENICQNMTFAKGIGLPGKIWQDGKAHWITDITKDVNFLRVIGASKSGLKSAMGFPIEIAGEFIGVIEFFHSNVLKVDLRLLEVFESIGAQIGQFAIRRSSEEALIQEQQRLSSIIEATNVGTWEWNVQSGEAVFNERWAQIIGYTLEELSPISFETWLKLEHPEDLKTSRELLDKHFKGEIGYYECEVRAQHKNGQWIWVLNRGKIISKDSEGKPLMMSGTRQDITNRKEAEIKAIEAIQIKSEFISMVSHELRTPLTIIRESVSIVYDEIAGTINLEQKDFLQIAKNNVDRLARLINDVLDYQKFEAQSMKMKIVKQSINLVVLEVGESFRLTLEKKSLKLRIKLHENLPNIPFDKDKIIQVLTNLLNNAMKFTQKGTITLMTDKFGDNAIQVLVKDEGLGIKEEDMDKLFKSFSQISTGRGRKTGGTGLGLVLCKKILEEHRGKIGVSSVFGEGSIFYFILPIEERRVRGPGR